MSTSGGCPPIPDEHSQAYWDAAAEHRLLIQRCTACGRMQFYPRRHCTSCFAPEPEWYEAAGTGRLHTFSVVERTPNAEFVADCPYVLAIVELDEGVRMTSRIVDAPVDRLACGARVRVAFHHVTAGITLPVFRLAEELL